MSNGIIPFADHGNKIATYDGSNLLEIFGSASALHSAILAGDFSRIHIGDFFPITINGSFIDAATGETKTLTSAALKLEVAAINPYLRHGSTSIASQHILVCSRDCLPIALQMRSANNVWYDTTQVNPWRGSALWETLNNAENGVIKLLENTTIGPYIYGGPNGNGMLAILPSMAAGEGAPTGATWTDRGKLFLPTEREVYGVPAWSSASAFEAGTLYNKWPLFAGSSRHLIKAPSDASTGRCGWWLANAATSGTFCYLNFTGQALYTAASSGANYIPLCFLIT